MEIWKDIEGYEGLYQVSNLGRVKSIYGWCGNRFVKRTKILKLKINNKGYTKVYLYKNKKSKMFFVHRLVAMAFVPNPNNLPQVNHKDGNKLNNSIGNLEWCTCSENIKHAYKTGLKHYVNHTII